MKTNSMNCWETSKRSKISPVSLESLQLGTWIKVQTKQGISPAIIRILNKENIAKVQWSNANKCLHFLKVHSIFNAMILSIVLKLERRNIPVWRGWNVREWSDIWIMPFSRDVGLASTFQKLLQAPGCGEPHASLCTDPQTWKEIAWITITTHF